MQHGSGSKIIWECFSLSGRGMAWLMDGDKCKRLQEKTCYSLQKRCNQGCGLTELMPFCPEWLGKTVSLWMRRAGIGMPQKCATLLRFSFVKRYWNSLPILFCFTIMCYLVLVYLIKSQVCGCNAAKWGNQQQIKIFARYLLMIFKLYDSMSQNTFQ